MVNADMNSDHKSPIHPKWDEKTIEAVGDLAGDPLDSRKTRSQFHNALSTCELNISKRCFMMVGYDPHTYQEASVNPIFQTFMQEEFKSLKDNETSKLVPLPSKRKLVQCKWVYRTKVAFDGSDIKYKARLVSKGFSQVQEVDYTETFALVAKMDSIRLFLVIVESKRWEVHHIDVKV